jgi:hypothetical protein
MKYAEEMGSIDMIYTYITSFIKTGSAIQKLLGGLQTQTQLQNQECISIFYFFKIRKAG